jgi:catechol 2,3-dioxygenase-like lactoylglutathione lyase family enzyme
MIRLIDNEDSEELSMRLSAAVALFGSLLCGATLAQAPSAPAAAKPSAVTIGFMHAIHATHDLEKTAAFYRDVFGVDAPVRDFTNPAVPILTNAPGATLRVSMLTLPGQGFNFELTQFNNVERRRAQPNIVDPGAPHMKFLVRDIDTVVANIKKTAAPIITTSAAPVSLNTPLGEAKAIFVRDPDGYIVEAIQMPAGPDAPPGNVIGAIMGLTVRDMNETMKFWQGSLGWQLAGDLEFQNDQMTLDLMGVPRSAEYRAMSAVVPGSHARMVFIEFRGVPRSEFNLRVPDPGASGMAIRVAAIHDLLPRLRAQGVRVVSRGGELVKWSESLRNVFVKDPNGLNVELVGEVPK